MNNARAIRLKTRGQQHGPITRLVSPSDLGQILKPFVFLDLFDTGDNPMSSGGFGWHPHSGIATVSLLIEGKSWTQETDLERHELNTNDVEWVMAGDGVWHTGGSLSSGRTKGFQLWLALPPELEEQPAQAAYIKADEIPQVGPARVLFGHYEGKESPATQPVGSTYLDVKLAAGEEWLFTPPTGHTVAFAMVHQGSVNVGEEVKTGELAVFEESQDGILFKAIGDSHMVVGSAIKHSHELTMGQYSVHTNRDSLQRGEQNIRNIGQDMRNQGLI